MNENKTKKKFIPIVLALILAIGGAAAFAVTAAARRHAEKTDFLKDGILKVTLDPGHGGDDNGASDESGVRLEKDDNLTLALAVREELTALRPEVEILMTRDSDTYPSLEERADMSNNFDSDIFVALHRNSAEGASGVEVWVESTKPRASSFLASSILSGLEQVGISSNRGVKYGTAGNDGSDYYVNAATDCPSCLVELGFISSEEDNSLFDEHMNSYARAIAKGILDTIDKFK